MAVTKRTRKANGKKISFFHSEVYVRGARVADRTFETQAAAHDWHDKEKSKWETGQTPGVPLFQEATFEDCLNRYLEEAFPRLRKSSQQTIEARFTYFKDAPVARTKMRDFSAQTVDQWLNWLYRHPTKDNPGRKSFLHELKYLTLILTWYRNYIDPLFVLPIVKRHRERCFFKHVAQRRPDYFIKPEDVQRWVMWLKDHRQNPMYYCLATFMVLTGTRVSEACGLCWDAVDLESGMARIIRTIRWDHWTRQPTLEDCTKTEESMRILPLAADLKAMLTEMRQSTVNSKALVFHDRNGNALRYNAIQSAFNAGFKALDLPWRSTHICRHTFGTLALFATRDLSAVQASLGHKNQRMTERYAKTIAMLSSNTADKTAKLMCLGPVNHVQNHVLNLEKG